MTRTLGLLLIATLVATPAAAEVITLAPAELRCQKFIGKQANRLARIAHNARRKCHDEGAAAPCGDDKIARTANKLTEKLAKKCAVTLEDLGFPGLCTDPDGAPFAPPELGACVIDSHLAETDAAIATEYPGSGQLFERDSERCRRRIGRAAGRFIDLSIKHRQRCLNGQLRGKLPQTLNCRAAMPPAGTGTGDAKIDRKIQKTNAQLTKLVGKACSNVTLEGLGFPGNCSDPNGTPFTLDELDACLHDTLKTSAAFLLAIEYPGDTTAPGATATATATPAATATPTASIGGGPTETATAGGGATPTATSTPGGTPTETSTPPPAPTPTQTPLPGFDDLAALVGPSGDADGDGFTNAHELAACSNPADPASTPENDNTTCVGPTIFSDTFGPSWGNSDRSTDPTYNAAVGAQIAQNALDCTVYCNTTPNLGSQQACQGVWPWSGVPERAEYAEGETVEVMFPDEDGNNLHGTLFLPPGVTCVPDGEPTCDGVTDNVVCTAPGGATYPGVTITDGFLGSERMYFWAAHRLAKAGYIAMTFDVSGQGKSQGQFPNPDDPIAPGDAGFSRDTGAAVNFLVSPANPVQHLLAIDPIAIENQATQETHVEQYVIGVTGHSLGARAVIGYQQSEETTLYPGRARAVVAWSHFDSSPTIGNVPIQLHSGDEDNGFIQPPALSPDIADEMQVRYERLAGDRDLDGTPDFTPHDRQIIMMEDGSHLSYSEVPWAYYPTWSVEVQYHYTLAWFDKYLKDDVSRTMSGVVGNEIQSVDEFNDYAACTSGADCFSATSRLKHNHVHLSNIWCSRYDVEGDATEDMKGGGCRTE